MPGARARLAGARGRGCCRGLGARRPVDPVSGAEGGPQASGGPSGSPTGSPRRPRRRGRLLLVLLPDGRLPSPRWRPVVGGPRRRPVPGPGRRSGPSRPRGGAGLVPRGLARDVVNPVGPPARPPCRRPLEGLDTVLLQVPLLLVPGGLRRPAAPGRARRSGAGRRHAARGLGDGPGRRGRPRRVARGRRRARRPGRRASSRPQLDRHRARATAPSRRHPGPAGLVSRC